MDNALNDSLGMIVICANTAQYTVCTVSVFSRVLKLNVFVRRILGEIAHKSNGAVK